jgi:hypothetical protein
VAHARIFDCIVGWISSPDGPSGIGPAIITIPGETSYAGCDPDQCHLRIRLRGVLPISPSFG